MRGMYRMAAAAAVFLMAVVPVAQAEDESKIAEGGLLYDNWPERTVGVAPTGDNPNYKGTGSVKGANSWRCKECHGWDYLGKDGAYATGSHATGTKGINGMAGADPAKVLAVLKDKTHGFPKDSLTDDEYETLALFVAKGQIDMSKAYDLQTKKAKGDAAKGAGYFNTICAKCHGEDGKKPKDMPETLGSFATRVPNEVVHKIRNSDPAGKQMPALRALPEQIHIDILTYAQSLPKER